MKKLFLWGDFKMSQNNHFCAKYHVLQLVRKLRCYNLRFRKNSCIMVNRQTVMRFCIFLNFKIIQEMCHFCATIISWEIDKVQKKCQKNKVHEKQMSFYIPSVVLSHLGVVLAFFKCYRFCHSLIAISLNTAMRNFFQILSQIFFEC